jgi:signal transduction histidine kinase
VQRNIVTLSGLLAKLPQFRQQIDAGQPTLSDAYRFYNQIIDEFVEGLNGLAQGAPDAQTAYLRVIAVPLFTSADEMQRADALAAAGVAGGGLNEADFRTYVGQIGAYHAQLDVAVPRMIPEVKAKYDQLVASDSWKQLTAVENAFLRGNQTKLPVPEAQWRTAARNVGNRLARLREDTLDIAEVRLPELVERVRAGESVDLDSEVSLLDHGEDEIGQVADAFNTAQQTAIAAAVDEAKTREGTNAVFLNIAHRSQVIVHRQLKVLDQVERKQADPDQLDTLFQLDHLSTRARRNAENLIILGGGQPGRQWRNPVSLAEVARGASAETETSRGVKMSKLPPIAVNGPVVGDLVHLLAELIDNATTFSPPESCVEIRGNVVGRGVVIEVEDQGLGIESEQAEQVNAMLHDPPDFGIMALSAEPRIGLFVVARLAARHGISVTLRESAYGGTRAIVLVRSELLGSLPESEDEPPAAEAAAEAAAARSARRPRHRTESPAEAAPAAAPQVEPQLDAPTRMDMFRPQHPAWPAQESRPAQETRPVLESRPVQDVRAPQSARPPQPRRPEPPGRPPLPQRRRQQNLVPPLMEDRPAIDREESWLETPEQARSRLSAFQQGTRRARDQEFSDIGTADINNGMEIEPNGQRRSQ